MKRIISVIFKHLALCNRFTHVPTSLLPLQVFTLISQYTASVYCFYSDYSVFYIFCKLKRHPVSLPYLTDILKRDTLTVIQHTRQYFLTGGSHFHEIKKTSFHHFRRNLSVSGTYRCAFSCTALGNLCRRRYGQRNEPYRLAAQWQPVAVRSL